MCGHTWMLSTWQIMLRFALNIVETKCVLYWEARGLNAFLFIVATPFPSNGPISLSFLALFPSFLSSFTDPGSFYTL